MLITQSCSPLCRRADFRECVPLFLCSRDCTCKIYHSWMCFSFQLVEKRWIVISLISTLGMSEWKFDSCVVETGWGCFKHAGIVGWGVIALKLYTRFCSRIQLKLQFTFSLTVGLSHNCWSKHMHCSFYTISSIPKFEIEHV